jgi:hypothetical protein
MNAALILSNRMKMQNKGNARGLTEATEKNHTRNLSVQPLTYKYKYYIWVVCVGDCFCGLVVGVPGTDSEVLGSIPGATRFSEK